MTVHWHDLLSSPTCWCGYPKIPYRELLCGPCSHIVGARLKWKLATAMRQVSYLAWYRLARWHLVRSGVTVATAPPGGLRNTRRHNAAA